MNKSTKISIALLYFTTLLLLVGKLNLIEIILFIAIYLISFEYKGKKYILEVIISIIPVIDIYFYDKQISTIKFKMLPGTRTDIVLDNMILLAVLTGIFVISYKKNKERIDKNRKTTVTIMISILLYFIFGTFFLSKEMSIAILGYVVVIVSKLENLEKNSQLYKCIFFVLLMLTLTSLKVEYENISGIKENFEKTAPIVVP